MRLMLPLLIIQLFSSNIVIADGVYGEDDRTEVMNSSELLQELAKSVGFMMNKEKYSSFLQAGLIVPEITFQNERKLCADEKFAEQPSLEGCTGFLIAPNLLLTAGHCVAFESYPCEDFVWVFDYKKNKVQDAFLNEAEFAYCKEVKALGFDPLKKMDYAIIELTENLDRPTLKLSQKTPRQGDRLVTIGHPNGLPQKVTDNGFVLNVDKNFFGNKVFQIVHNLDLFTGNSGSPIIDERSGEVIAIATSGEEDFELDGNCNRVKTYIMKPDLAEVAMSVSQIRELR